MEWNSKQYLKFEKQRTQPARDLLASIELQNPVTILDIGCGPGNSTNILKTRYQNAQVTGIDNSENMLMNARASYPQINFECFNATEDLSKLNQKFDIVFSNACIQWVPNHYQLLPNMMNILNDNGVLAVQAPMQRTQAREIVYAVVNTEKWKDRFNFKQTFNSLTPSEYVDILSEIASEFSIWETVYYHIMPSHQGILEWVKGTNLKPYLSVLDPDECADLERDILDKIKQEYPLQKNGEIIFKFPRLFFTAVK